MSKTIHRERLNYSTAILFLTALLAALAFGIIAATPQTAYAETQATKEFDTTPNSYIKIEWGNLQTGGCEVLVGAPGDEKRRNKTEPIKTPFSGGCVYKVPDGQTRTSVKIIAYDDIPSSSLYNAMNIRFFNGQSESSITKDNHYSLSGSVYYVDETRATITGSGFGIYWDTLQSFTNLRILYSEDPNFASRNFTGDKVANANGGWAGAYTTFLTGLKPNTTYYYQSACDMQTLRAGISGHYAKQQCYGEVRSFTTKGTPVVEKPKVTTGDAINIEKTTATIDKNTYENFDGHTIYMAGNQYSTDPNLGWSLMQTSPTTQSPYSTNLSYLTPDTTYYYRAIVYSNQGIYYGEIKSFTTPPNIVAKPVVVTGDAINIDKTAATIDKNSYENFDGHYIFMAGNQYSTDPNLSWSQMQISPTVQSPYSINLSYLTPGTTYYYRAMVYSNQGVYYGEIKSFRTLPNIVDAPDVITGDHQNVRYTTVDIANNIYKNFEGYTILEVGNQYATNKDMTNSLVNKTAASNVTPFDTRATGLRDNTTYYYRAYVKTTQGTVYGEVKSFKTLRLI